MAQSILAKEFVEIILATARRNLERDGYLQSVLFLHMADGQKLVCALKFPETSQERQAYLRYVGQCLTREGKIVDEAVVIIEGWFVEVQETRQDLALPPSEHPRRQEAIVVMGRDCKNTRTTSVIQTFSRGQRGNPEWQPIKLARFNESTDRGEVSMGLLDYLFAEQAVGQSGSLPN